MHKPLAIWLIFARATLSLGAAALLGMRLILAGVIVINIFSKTVSHYKYNKLIY